MLHFAPINVRRCEATCVASSPIIESRNATQNAKRNRNDARRTFAARRTNDKRLLALTAQQLFGRHRRDVAVVARIFANRTETRAVQITEQRQTDRYTAPFTWPKRAGVEVAKTVAGKTTDIVL